MSDHLNYLAFVSILVLKKQIICLIYFKNAADRQFYKHFLNR